jgi:trigger factor
MPNSTPNPRDIPEPLKREVRQRCGFGCVLCGLPLYEYHHIEAWAEVKEHVADNITLLCTQHHREASNGLLTPSQVRTANSDPVNVSRGWTSPYGLHFDLEQHSTFHAVVGSNRFSASAQKDTSIISIDDVDLVWVRIDEQGQLLLHMNVFDEFNNLALVAIRNELVHASSLWDITFVGNTLTLREAKRALLLEISFLPPRTLSIDRGCLLFNGVEIVIKPELIYCSGRVLAGSLIHDCQAGLVVGRNDRRFGAAIACPDVCRYSPELRRRNKQGARKAQANLSDFVEPHPATGSERYVSTVSGAEDFYIIDDPRETDTNE